MLILLELFPNVFEVHYKLLQRILQNFDAGGLLSGWSFVRGWHFQWAFVRWSFVRTPVSTACYAERCTSYDKSVRVSVGMKFGVIVPQVHTSIDGVGISM